MPGLWCYGALHDTKGLVVNWLPMYCLWVTCGNWSTFRLWLNRLAGFHSIWAWACTVPDWLPAFLVEEGSCIIVAVSSTSVLLTVGNVLCGLVGDVINTPTDIAEMFEDHTKFFEVVIFFWGGGTCLPMCSLTGDSSWQQQQAGQYCHLNVDFDVNEHVIVDDCLLLASLLPVLISYWETWLIQTIAIQFTCKFTTILLYKLNTNDFHVN